jgi:hypothetical protein
VLLIRAASYRRKQGASVVNILLYSGALVLSFGWLLPIHYLPWSSFHSDAWVAGILLVLSTVSLIKVRSQQPWPHFAIFVAALSLVPLIQLAAGQIRLAGTAWISSLYLFGFLLAILTGARWQSRRGNELTDALFLAIGAAVPVLVGMQLCQWLKVTEGCLCSNDWVLPRISNSRISANLAQPNQLATLLLLGIVAYAWAWVRQTLNGLVVIFAIVLLLTGLALTESLTGVVSLSLLLLCTWYWRRLLPPRLAPYVATALFLFFILMFVMQKFLTQWLLLDYASDFEARVKTASRLDMWPMFIRAAFEQPWLGYGWNQSLLAQVMTTTSQTTTRGVPSEVTSYAHNLFIDLTLWLGIPLGLLASAAALAWLVRAASHVQNSQDALLVLAVMIMGVHAMLELPLYYAYFLLPLGLIVGMIDVRSHHRPAFTTGMQPVVCLWLVCSTLFVVAVKEYFVVEQSYSELRIEAARITSKSTRHPPDVLLLTQLRDLIILASLGPESNMTQEKIDWVTNVTLIYPSEHNLLKLATVLALNGRETQAIGWLNKLCNLYPGARCTKAQIEWGRLQNQFPQLLKVGWTAVPEKPNVQFN